MRKLSGNKKALTAAVLAALLAIPYCAAASATKYAVYNGKNVAELVFFDKGEGITDEDGNEIKAAYKLNSALAAATMAGAGYWTDMLGAKTKNGQPWQVFVTTEEANGNASAQTISLTVKNGKRRQGGENLVAQQLQKGRTLSRFTPEVAQSENPPDGSYAFSIISVGQYLGANRTGATYGWWIDPGSALPTNEQSGDFLGTIRHELGHALGIANETQYIDANGKPYEPQSEEDIRTYKTTEEQMVRFSSKVNSASSWNMHLVDQNGNPARPGMQIVSSTIFKEKKAKDSSLKESDFFIVNNKNNGEDMSGKNGKAFFVGNHVREALDGATFFGVSGLPVNTWEETEFEGSHLQTAGMMSHRPYSNYTSFMEAELAVMQDMGYELDRKAYFGKSVYGNGGTITNTQGYFARNAAGTAYIEGRASQVPLGVGLHIYGSKNTVTQAADILTEGTGAVGVRVDGMQNTLVIPKSTAIHADGSRGNGIMIAYGRNQVVNQAGTVTASGKKGTGIRFDFGSSSNGASDEYRGSYIRFAREVEEETGNITNTENLALTGMDSNQYNAGKLELDGPLVKEYNLSGKLSGAENAVYIGRNAFVKDINVNEGAAITGNITSEWKHFHTDGSYDGVSETEAVREPEFSDWLRDKHPDISMDVFLDLSEEQQAAYSEEWENDPDVKETTVTKSTPALRIQYNGKREEEGYAYTDYIPSLVTNLNFNANMAYNGNITGADNMKLNVKGGMLVYGGKADVVGVTVAKGAILLGGSYTVHDMSGDVAADFASKLDDTDKGNFISHGTIGSAVADKTMNITGNLVSDGTLSAYGGGSRGYINVKGNADIMGSTVSGTNLLPDEKAKALTAKALSGGDGITNPEGKATAISGMLDGFGSVEGTAVYVTASTANNLNGADASQNKTFGAMTAMYSNLKNNGDDRVNEMRTLFSLSPSAAKEALSAIASNAPAKSMAVAQRSLMTQRILSSRLNEAFTEKPVKVKLPTANLDGNGEDGLDISLNLLEPADNDIWLKFGKDWGDARGDVDYHSSATLLGYDREVAPNWRAGLYAEHNRIGFADKTAGNELRDTRFGLYAGYNKGGREAMAYLDYGWMRNKLRRGITGLGLTANARYHSRILELGGEYLYDLHATKNAPWHVRPYVNAQLSRLWQDGYSEDGAGVFNQIVNGKNNDYFGAGLGVEFKRYLAGNNYAVRVGMKRAFAGAEPKLRYSYMGDRTNTYDMRNVQDKTHFVLSIGGEANVAKGWTVGGDAGFIRGAHDKEWSCSVTVKCMW